MPSCIITPSPTLKTPAHTYFSLSPSLISRLFSHSTSLAYLLTIHCTRTGTRSSGLRSSPAFRPPVRQETLDELTLSVPRLAAVVHVVHRHVHMRLVKHALHNHRVVSVVDQESRKTVPQIVESEPWAVVRYHPGSDRRRSDVVLHNHAAEPGLLAMQLEGREQEIRILAVRCFLMPAPQQGRKSLVHLDRSLRSP